MAEYIPHPKFKRPLGAYTDDTQMTLGLAEHMLSDFPWTQGNLAERWVNGFHRDPHTGYAQGFYDFLLKTVSAEQFLANIQPHSIKNGGAMRAFPVGFLPDPMEVRDKAMFQASLTHATYDGMRAAAAAALTFHFCYHKKGTRDKLGPFLETWLPGTNWMAGLTLRGDPTMGVLTVQRAIGVLCRSQTLEDAIQMAVSLGGDTDTVAAIVAPCAAVCDHVRNTLPNVLIEKLENGPYGRDFIIEIDKGLVNKYPPRKPFIQPPKPPKPPKPIVQHVPVHRDPSEDGPLDFLFDD